MTVEEQITFASLPEYFCNKRKVSQ